MNKSRFAAVCSVALLTTLLAATRAADIYVSPTGNDANLGTIDQPLRTLEHARDLARAQSKEMATDLTIHLAAGVYQLSQPLVLTANDSGQNGHDIIYAALPDQHPIISGGIPVTGWKLVDANKNLWSAPAPQELKNTRQLYIDGIRAQRAAGRLPTKLTETPTGYTAASDMMSHWRNPSDIEFVYTGGNGIWGQPSEGLGPWTEPRCPVAAIDGTNITMAQPCWNNSTRRVMLPPDSEFKRAANLVGPAHFGKEPAYIENAYELLGIPGQWYFDRSEGKIYYTPRPGEDLTKADVEAPLLEKLIQADGSPEQPIHNIIFRNLQFSYATWLFPSTGEGFSEIQANYMVTGDDGYATQGLGNLVPNGKSPFGAWTKTPGNISFSYDNHVRFEEDHFEHLGAAGLEFGHGSQSNTVEGCVFTDISGNGTELGGVDLPQASAAQLTADNKIDNNYFHDIGAEFHGGIAIVVGYAQRTLIEHNQIDHVPYSGISIGWGGWLDKIKQPGVANNSQNNVISNNLIFDHMLLLCDGAGIYTQGQTGPSLADGEKVDANVVRDQFSTGHAIYSDNGSANMTITSNVMFHTNHDNWGTAHANYYDGNDGKTRDPFDIRNNYWQQGNPDSSRENVTIKGNHLISDLSQVPPAILQNAGLSEPFKNILTEQTVKSAPEAPDRVAASAGDGFVYLTWTPPRFEGGAPVDSYTVTSSKNDTATIAAANFRDFAYLKFPSLTNDTPYTFTVTATNANGISVFSLPTAPITPKSKSIEPPAAPTIATVYAGDGAASIHFAAPDSDGGSPVTSYIFTAEPGGKKLELTGRKVLTLGGKHVTFAVLGGLENGTTYTIEAAAQNAAGLGPAAKSKPITPSSHASAPSDEP
jgi:Right handed beta helix region/Fibronectin type III domain